MAKMLVSGPDGELYEISRSKARLLSTATCEPSEEVFPKGADYDVMEDLTMAGRMRIDPPDSASLSSLT